MDLQDLPHIVIRAAMQVHETLGPGLMREVYDECLAAELQTLEVPFERVVPLVFDYRGRRIQTAARMDFLVDEMVPVRVLAADVVAVLERQAVESWLRLAGFKTALIINFQVPVLRKGVHRITLKRRE
jgi:GxxExxY protein